MAQEIGAWASTPDNLIRAGGKETFYADLTATSAATDLGFTSTNYVAVIYVKAFTAGTGTIGPLFNIEVADDSAFTLNVRTVASAYVQRADEQCAYLIGVNAKARQQFMRIKLTLSGTDTATYDAVVYAV